MKKTKKILQAINVLLTTTHSHQMSRLRVLKLLYIADRDHLKLNGRTITNDSYAAMDHGPIVSSTYNLVKGEHIDSSEYEKYYENDGQMIGRIDDPGRSELSASEINRLQRVAVERSDRNDYEIAIESHDFEEWKRNKPTPSSSNAIPLDDIITAVGRSKDKSRIVEEHEDQKILDQIFGADS